MVLVHLSTGVPARATELLSIQHTNGVEARNQRGVFIDNSTVSFITAYYKGFSAPDGERTPSRGVRCE
jgi:hypothetical protein